MSPSVDSNSDSSWISISLKHAPHCMVWVMIQPPSLPNGVLIRIPNETHAKLAKTNLLHLRHILDSANISPEKVKNWNVHGTIEQSMFGWNPAFEQVIPKSNAGQESEIVVFLDLPEQPTSNAQQAPPPVTPVVVSPAQLQKLSPSDPVSPVDLSKVQTFDYIKGIEADWLGVLQMEKQLVQLRNQLNTTQASLDALNRDLTASEFVKADQQDKKNWQDARRWLRDIATKVSCSVRDHDIGLTSGAGRRDWFEKMYETLCVQKASVPNLAEIHREFGNFRKLVKNLYSSMSSIKSVAQRDGIQRANRILSTIRSKKRDPRRGR